MVFVWATASYSLVEISHAVSTFTAISSSSLVISLDSSKPCICKKHVK